MDTSLSAEGLRLIGRLFTKKVLANGNDSRTGPEGEGSVDEFPLSLAQEEFWLLEKMHRADAAYNVHFFARVDGAIDAQCLSSSLAKVIERHEMLRSRVVPSSDELPRHVLQNDSGPSLQIVRLDQVAPPLQEKSALELAGKWAFQPFDLANEPPLRVMLIQSGSEKSYLLVVAHHIVMDAWSMAILLRELAGMYTDHLQSRSVSLESVPGRYADHVAGERQKRARGDFERGLEYWRRRLSDAELTELPTDFQRTATRTLEGASVSVDIDRWMLARLTSVAESHGVTLFTVLLSAYQLLLMKWTGVVDVVVGTVFAGRKSRSDEAVIGLFVNTLLVRSDLQGNPSFSALLQRVRGDVLESLEHADVPFKLLAEALSPARDPGRHPWVQSAFVFQDTPVRNIGLGEHALEQIEIESRYAKVDLSVHIRPFNGQMRCQFEYATDLFSHATVEALSLQYLSVLKSIVDQPERRLSEIVLVPGLRARPDSEKVGEGHGVQENLVAGFERQVSAHPSATAVDALEGQWSYRELDVEANAIANLLLSIDPRPGEPVGVALGYCREMVAAVIGILKAGKYYVPIETSDGVERQRSLVRACGIRHVLTPGVHSPLAEILEAEDVGLIPITGRTRVSSAKPNVVRRPEMLSYCIFTSGSTGTPKGVVQSDANVLKHIRAYSTSLQLSPEDRVSLFARLGFDAAVMDLFGALLNGACLCLYDVATHGVAEIGQWLRRSALTVWHSTPTLLRLAAEQISDRESQVRVVVLGGEEVHERDVQMFNKTFPATTRFINGYGPTESTTATQFEVNRAHPKAQSPGRVPIGAPIGDTRILLLDRDGRPTDVFGELALCGPHIALGYWNEPSLTATKFVPCPVGSGRRMYRTGDLVRWRPDHHLEFARRIDGDLKIRGLQVSVTAVRSAILTHPQMKDVVLTVRDIDGHPELVAYLCMSEATSSEEVRSFLRQKLPEHMVPACLIWLETLPLLQNGKVDLRRLPEPSLSAITSTAHSALPSGVSEVVLSIFVDILKRDDLDAEGNFFTFGGHSLRAMQAVARIRQTLAIDLPLSTLFEHPTAADLSREIESHAGRAAYGS